MSYSEWTASNENVQYLDGSIPSSGPCWLKTHLFQFGSTLTQPDPTHSHTCVKSESFMIKSLKLLIFQTGIKEISSVFQTYSKQKRTCIKYSKFDPTLLGIIFPLTASPHRQRHVFTVTNNNLFKLASHFPCHKSRGSYFNFGRVWM